MIKRWKFLTKKGKTIKSENGDLTWKIGEWNRVDGELDLCEVGLHCSKKAYDAFSYIQSDICALVECRGKHLASDDKECWEEQRIIKAYKWTKKDSLKLAIFSAELVLKNFEKEYPDDKGPRGAIEAAKKVLFHDTALNRSAAKSAEYAAWFAAWSAAKSAKSAEYVAWFAAWSAAWSAAWFAAWSAAKSAAWFAAESAAEYAVRSAAKSAAKSAEYAAWSAGSAAKSAAWFAAESAEYAAMPDAPATIKKIQRYFDSLVKDLKEI